MSTLFTDETYLNIRGCAAAFFRSAIVAGKGSAPLGTDFATSLAAQSDRIVALQ
jgi:hypothetical protein